MRGPRRRLAIVTDELRAPRSLRRVDVLEASTVGLVALAVAFTNIAFRSVWRDEATTVDALAGSWSYFLHKWYEQNFVMGLYFAMVKVWVGIGGYSVRSLRSLSALAVVGLAVACWLGARRLWGRLAATAAVVLVLTSQALVLAGHDARTYAMTALFAVCTYLCALRPLSAGRGVVLFWFVAACTCYLHPLATLAVLGMIVGALVAGPGPARLRAVKMTLGLPVLLSPLAMAQLHARTELYWVQRPTLRGVGEAIRWLVIGIAPPTASAVRIAVVSVGVLLAVLPRKLSLGAAVVARPETAEFTATVPVTIDHEWSNLAWSDRWTFQGTVTPPTIGLLVGWATVPTLSLLLLSNLGRPMFVDRYVLVSLPAVILLTASGLARLHLIPAIPAIAAVLLLWWSPLATSLRWQAPENWWAAFHASDARREPTDVVIAGAGRNTMSYYYSLLAERPTEAFAIYGLPAGNAPFAESGKLLVDETISSLPVDRTVWLFSFEGQPTDPIAPLGDALARVRCVAFDKQFDLVRVRSFSLAC